MQLKPLAKKSLPQAFPLKKLIGPSFVILGMGLGSGELVMWPYLTSHYGMGIIWGAVLGITLQFFMNMEIERYALVHGESIFVGFARKCKKLPIWFILSTFIPWIWPGIIATSATIIGKMTGIDNTKYLSIGLLIFIGLILSLGPTLYKTVESFQKYITILGVPAIFIFTILVAKLSHWQDLSLGLVGIGNGYWLLPAGIPIASFLGALAYAGAGGNLNLAQSSYIREKGYGMGIYAGKIRGLFKKSEQEFTLNGVTFETTEENISIFKKWWKSINLEHLIVFWATGALTIAFLGLLSYATTYGKLNPSEGIDFLILESKIIGQTLIPFAGALFLVVAATTIFGTQLGVFDATSRIISENVVLLSNKLEEKKIPNVYYIVLWAQIIASITILLLGFSQPLQLITISAVLNAFTMFVHVGLTLWTNTTILEKPLRPKLFRRLAMSFAFVFYGGFSLYTIIDKFF